MADLVTRLAASRVVSPLVLVESEEFAGGWEAAVGLVAADRVDRCVVFDATDRSTGLADLGGFELVEWDHRIAGLEDALPAVAELSARDVVVVDVSWLWGALKDLVTWRARRAKAAERLLADDPNAEIVAGRNLWQDADDRFWRIVAQLRAAPPTAVLVVDVNTDDQGRVDSKPGLAAAVHAWVRFDRGATPRLIGARGVDVPPGGLHLDGVIPLADVLDLVVGPADPPAPAGPSGPVDLPVGDSDPAGVDLEADPTGDVLSTDVCLDCGDPITDDQARVVELGRGERHVDCGAVEAAGPDPWDEEPSS